MASAIQPIGVHDQVSSKSYTPYTELHWVAGVDAGGRRGKADRESFAVVSSELGARDWCGIDPAPVRRVAGTPGGIAIPAAYPWLRTEQPKWIWCESQFERREVMWLDWGQELVTLWSQPFAITFPADRPGLVWHVPDLLGLCPDGSLKLFDVRPADRINEKAQRIFDATSEVCDTLGWPYAVLDGHSEIASRTLEWLKASRHARCAPPVDVEDRLLTHARRYVLTPS